MKSDDCALFPQSVDHRPLGAIFVGFIDPGSAVQKLHCLPGPSVVTWTILRNDRLWYVDPWIPGSFIDPILRNSIIVLFDVYELDRMISLIKLICVSQLVILKIFFIHKIVSFEKIVKYYF